MAEEAPVKMMELTTVLDKPAADTMSTSSVVIDVKIEDTKTTAKVEKSSEAKKEEDVSLVSIREV